MNYPIIYITSKRKIKHITTRTQHLVWDQGEYNSMGAYILLKNYYRNLEDQNYIERVHSNKTWYKQVIFNKAFLEKKLAEKGKLQCAYCGRDDLVVYDMFDGGHGKTNMATADHFIPKSEGGKAFDESNLVVACNKCNGTKGSKIYNEDTLKFL